MPKQLLAWLEGGALHWDDGDVVVTPLHVLPVPPEYEPATFVSGDKKAQHAGHYDRTLLEKMSNPRLKGGFKKNLNNWGFKAVSGVMCTLRT